MPLSKTGSHDVNSNKIKKLEAELTNPNFMLHAYLVLQVCLYEGYSESKYRFAVKNNRVRFHIKFYCFQIQHSSNYFSTYLPPLLRHLL